MGKKLLTLFSFKPQNIESFNIFTHFSEFWYVSSKRAYSIYCENVFLNIGVCISFSVAAVTNYYKFNGLKQPKLILLMSFLFYLFCSSWYPNKVDTSHLEVIYSESFLRWSSPLLQGSDMIHKPGHLSGKIAHIVGLLVCLFIMSLTCSLIHCSF